MKRLRLQFCKALLYLSTILYFFCGAMAVFELSNLTPPRLKTLMAYLFRTDFLTSISPQLNRTWPFLALAAIIFFLIARSAYRRKLLWRPPGFETHPAPDGGILRKATIEDLKKGSKKGSPAARRQATQSFRAAEGLFAANKYQDAAAEYQKSAFQISTMSAYMNQGVSLCYTSYFQRAADAFEMALPIAQREVNDRFEAAILNNSGIPQKERGNLTEALTCFKQAYSISGTLGDNIGQACALGNIGSVYVLQGRTNEAMKSWENALDSFKQAGCLAGQAAALDNMGCVYSGKWNFKRALRLHRKAHRIFKRIHNLPGRLQTVSNIGAVCCKLGKQRRSLKASRQALKLAQRVGSLVGQAKALGTIGLAYEKKGELDDALESVQKSLELYKRVGSPLGIGNQLASIGVIYAAQEKKKEAMLKFGEARSKFLQIGARSEGYHTVETAIELSLHENS